MFTTSIKQRTIDLSIRPKTPLDLQSAEHSKVLIHLSIFSLRKSVRIMIELLLWRMYSFFMDLKYSFKEFGLYCLWRPFYLCLKLR